MQQKLIIFSLLFVVLKAENLLSLSVKNRGNKKTGSDFVATLLIVPEKSETLLVDSFLFSSNIPEISVKTWGLKEPVAASQMPKAKRRKRLATESFEICLKVHKKIKNKENTKFKVAFNCMAIVGTEKIPKYASSEMKI